MEAGANIYKKEPSRNSPIDEAKRKGFVELLNQMESFKQGKRLEKVEVNKASYSRRDKSKGGRSSKVA